VPPGLASHTLEDVSEPESGVPLESLYRAHHAFVWRNARRLGCDDASLDDVVHEVFLVVARRWPTFEGRSDVRTWLFSITYHVVRRLRRDRTRSLRKLENYGSEFENRQASPSTPDGALEFRRLLSHLDEPKRLVFILAELEGMTSVEVGRCLSMKVGTVDTRLRAARLQLRTLLERERSFPRRSPSP
jgi:RNA polymerase sigma-70 factor, ECF subfamily